MPPAHSEGGMNKVSEKKKEKQRRERSFRGETQPVLLGFNLFKQISG